MQGTYNLWLVALSLAVATLASFTTLSLVERLGGARGRQAGLWLAGGALTLGTGIWAMHFIGMLAFALPIPLGYDVPLTLLSLLVALAVAAAALWIASRATLGAATLLGGGTLLGLGIAAMHYTGMAALRMEPGIDYQAGWFLASLLVAIVAAVAALWIAFSLRVHPALYRAGRYLAAVVMGLAITGMHYTGMAAARFLPGSLCLAADKRVDNTWLASTVGIVTITLFALALFVATLDARLTRRTARLTRRLTEANRELRRITLLDPLTGLPNRMLFDDRLEQALRKAAHDGTRFALALIDLDGFKPVNDTLGHQIGDRLLISVAARLNAAIGPDDTLSRLGGDEFMLLTGPIADDEALAPLAQNLIDAIGQPFFIGREEIVLSASVGIALYPDDGAESKNLFAAADAALCHVKQSGKNGYQFFTPDMDRQAHSQLALQQELRRALERGGEGLLLHYQPKLELATGRVTGMEALVRWQHPVHGLLPPMRFIPLAEKSGLVVPLGRWVLNEACRQLAGWVAAGHELNLAINLSTQQFRHHALPGEVADCLRRHGLDAERLVLEITESAAMEQAETSIEVMRTLRDMGVTLSIDDFGTGYSSLAWLRRLPIQQLKIDKSFIHDRSDNAAGDAIVRAIILLAHTLKIAVVAEGIETEAQQRRLAELGCEKGQGFGIGRPMPAQAVEAWLAGMETRQRA